MFSGVIKYYLTFVHSHDSVVLSLLFGLCNLMNSENKNLNLFVFPTSSFV